MIRFNKITEYGIRVIRTMYQVNGQTISSVKISERENISLPMLMKVLRRLKQVGYIKSSRGRGDSCGGYSLVIDPRNLTLKDVVEALEGKIYISDCLYTQNEKHAGKDKKLRSEMESINDIIIQKLGQKTLSEMIS
jgi:Rrf2 family transcriptional regulator, iron-sulfur cluster assembly transcription factor